MSTRIWPAWLKYGLWLMAGLLVLILILVFFGKSLVISYLSPPEHFELSRSPPSPDYKKDYFWLAHHGKADSSDLIPALVDRQDDLSDKPVDVFFIHSTGYVGPGDWNSTMAVEFKRTPVDMLLARNPGYKFSQLPTLVSQLTWAQCQPDGRLEIAEQRDNAFSNHLNNADKSYHILDFSLFYGNIRDNARVRTRAYLSHLKLNKGSK